MSALPNEHKPQRLVVMGASAGGVDALTEVVRGLPHNFAAPVLVVLHISARSPSMLAAILDRASPLPASTAADHERMEPGRIYVATPDLHLTVVDGHLALTAEARINGHRPSIDALFCSAAEAYGSEVIGVVLSGMRDDGTTGLAKIKEHGGMAVVQDPQDAQHPSMPLSAIAHIAADAILPAGDIAAALNAMVAAPAPGTNGHSHEPDGDVADPLYTICPDCGGVLTEKRRAGVTVFECHVGHAFAPQTLVDRQADEVESALWTAVRALEDREALLTRLAGQAGTRGLERSAESFGREARSASEQADAVRRAIGVLARVQADET
ncbi:MAG: chemotaxis protein CheB [Solirubrobacteraceae bacterium]